MPLIACGGVASHKSRQRHGTFDISGLQVQYRLGRQQALGGRAIEPSKEHLTFPGITDLNRYQSCVAPAEINRDGQTAYVTSKSLWLAPASFHSLSRRHRLILPEAGELV